MTSIYSANKFSNWRDKKNSKNKNYFKILHVCIYIRYHGVPKEVRGQIVDLVLNSNHVGSRDQTQAIRFGGKHLIH